MPDFTYVEDRTGTQAANRVTNETHTITPVNGRDYAFFIPEHAPFNGDNFEMFEELGGNLYPLIPNKDFFFSLHFEAMALVSGNHFYASVNLADPSEKKYVYSYNSLGGPHTLDVPQMTALVAELTYNPRGVTWDEVVDVPAELRAMKHEVGPNAIIMSEAVPVGLSSIASAILTSATPTNPAPVDIDPAAIGLDKTPNFAAAILQDLLDASPDKVVTPAVLTQWMDRLGLLSLATTLEEFEEHMAARVGHEIDKADVDLGKVENLETASLQEGLQLTPVRKYVTMEVLTKILEAFSVLTGTGTRTGYPVKDSLLNEFCRNTSNIGIYADGFGGTYQKVIDARSVTCGYIAPTQAPMHPIKGQILDKYCVDTDMYALYADGYGGAFTNLMQSRSVACGWCAESEVCVTYMPAGTVIESLCEGTTMVRTISNGKGGTYTTRESNNDACVPDQIIPIGQLTLLVCEGYTQMGVYAGAGNTTYRAVLAQNSPECGYTPTTTPSPTPTTAPVSYPPAGTEVSFECVDGNRYTYFANGMGGTVRRMTRGADPACATETFPPVGTELRNFCRDNSRWVHLANGTGGYTEQLLSSSDPSCSASTPAPTSAPAVQQLTAAPPLLIENSVVRVNSGVNGQVELPDSTTILHFQNGVITGITGRSGFAYGGDEYNGWRIEPDGWLTQWKTESYADMVVGINMAFDFHHAYDQPPPVHSFEDMTQQPLMGKRQLELTTHRVVYRIDENMYLNAGGTVRTSVSGRISNARLRAIRGY